jgi:hypothetical protein
MRLVYNVGLLTCYIYSCPARTCAPGRLRCAYNMHLRPTGAPIMALVCFGVVGA